MTGVRCHWCTIAVAICNYVASAQLAVHLFYTQENNKMHIKPMLAIPICLFGVFVFWITGSNGVSIPNLTEQCYSCLCNVSTQCTLDHKCTGGYCGPFNISRIYWADAGRVVLPDDDPQRPSAWSDCTENYECAKKIIEGYLQKYGKDCNNDGVTDCYDYMMVNGNGGYDCGAPLNRSVNGRRWLKRYETCIL